METKTVLILGFVGALVIMAIGLIASSGKRLDSTEGEVFKELLTCIFFKISIRHQSGYL